MEHWDLYDKNRIKLNQTMIRGEGQPKGTYRMTVNIAMFDKNGRMLIQHRQPFKHGWSDMWDFTAAGSAVSGETSGQAAERELFEEIGYKASFEDNPPVFTLNFENNRGEYGFEDYYVIHAEPDISALSLQYEEVAEVKWATLDEILSMIDNGTFIPRQKSFVEFLFYMRNARSTITKSDYTVQKST